MKVKKIIAVMLAGVLTAASFTVPATAVTDSANQKYEFSIEDATNVQKYIVGMMDLSDEEKVLYDMDNDNTLSVFDVSLIQKTVIGLLPNTTEPSTDSVQPTSFAYTEPTTEVVEPTTESYTEVTTEYTEPTTEEYTESTTEYTEPTTESFTEATTEYTEPTTEETTEPVTVPKPTTVPTGVKLNKSSVILGVSESYTLTVTVENGDLSQVTFSTGNKNVATVGSNGKITAVGVGTTKIRCKAVNGAEGICTVTVKPLATSVTLNSTEIVMYIGDSFDLNSSIPNGTAAYYRLYSTSNSKVATVTQSGGIVKGIATGTATVTCTMINGKKATCKVYIMPQSKKISNVPLIGQSKLPTGCETCSATMLLKHYGYNISETSFANNYLIKKPLTYTNSGFEGPDPNCAFVGTPYSSNSFGAYAPVMAKSMNSYLSNKSYKATVVSGKSLEYLSGKYVAQGQPIMVWATINMSPSYKTTTWKVNYTDENAKYKLGSYYTWIAGEHCLVLTGYDSTYYYFNDPWTNARTRYSKSIVNSRYAELGKQAVVMVKK